MKINLVYLSAILLLIIGMSCQQSGSVKKVKLETPGDSAGYAIGILVGTNNREQLENIPGRSDINMDAMIAAFLDATNEVEGMMTLEEADLFIRNYFDAIGEREAQQSLEEGNAFLEGNKNKEGVRVTESGLQYEIITEGSGPKPGPADRVKVHYHGTLIDGTVFDSSVERGDPAEFGVGQVIPGWTEALQMMPTGSKWKIYVPSNIAYGERSPSPDIPSNAVLIFDVELLEILD